MPKPEERELREPLGVSGSLSRQDSVVSQQPGHDPRAGGLSTEEGDNDSNATKKDGFELSVFVPQLLLRLFPPLMLLQLVPDFQPRVDHLTLSSGFALIALGRFTWQSYLLGVGVFVVTMSLPAAIAAANALVWQCIGRGQETRQATQQKAPHGILLCIAGLASCVWDIHHKHADKHAVKGVDLQRDPWDSATLFTGFFLVFFVALAHLLWYIDTLWGSFIKAPDVSVWSKPQLTSWDIFWIFVERFPLGEIYVARPSPDRFFGEAQGRRLEGLLKLKGDINSTGWKSDATIELSRTLYKGARLERLRQLCKENGQGALLPVQVQTVVEMNVPCTEGLNDHRWCVKWEQYDRATHASLCLKISCNSTDNPPSLTLVADSVSADDWIGHGSRDGGGKYTTGYRVTIDPPPPHGAPEGNPAGDYLHGGNVVTMDRSLTGGKLKPLEFTESRSKRKLLYDEHGTRKWIIARPSLRATRMSQETYHPGTYHEPDFEVEQAHGDDWKKTGPPTTLSWIRPDRSINQSRPASPGKSRPASPGRANSVVPAAEAIAPGHDPSIPPTVRVDGFVTAAYEISFPRRIGISFKTLLGATVRANDQVEFLILQIELFFYSMLQFSAIYFILHVYAINKQVVRSQSQNLLEPDWWTSNSSIMLSDVIVEWIKQELLIPADPNSKDTNAMRLASSEVLLPTAMYIFVCIVNASEHAMWSGADTLSESREDRWYRRALKGSTTGDSIGADIRSRSSRNRGNVVLAIGLLLVGAFCGLAALMFSESILLTPAVASFFIAFICAGNVLGWWRRLADGWYRFVLYIFLRVRSCCSKHSLSSYEYNSAKEAFEKELRDTDNSLRASHSMDKRDSVRKHELMLTYIESPMWERFRAHGPDGFIRHFRGIDDAVISSDLEKLQQDMRVFPVSEPREAVNGELVRQRTNGDRYRNGVPIFDGTGRLEEQNSAETCVSAGHIADMIIGLSKARRLVHTRRNMLFVLVASALHAFVPVWHGWLPKILGGGCGVGHNEGLWKNDTAFGVPYDVGKLVACSESWPQMGFHGVCAFLNLTLSYSILNRLVKCRADYYARYLHMIYFIQLTPWSNLRTEKLKDHWGFLPRINLDTPGNVEAWNKLRLYLQSWQIKTSRYKQVSVLWCFIGVVLSAILKIVEMAVIQTQRDPDIDNSDYGCDLRHVLNQTEAKQRCDEIFGCKWVPESRDATTVWRTARCTFGGAKELCHKDTDTVDKCLNRNHNQYPICTWDIGKMQCDEIEQHFDTMSLFVVVETLVIGVGLLVTLWQGMLSNEIKREAFPHVLRHKHSELLSNSMHFVTERAQWETHRRYWRAAEVKLLALVDKLRTISAVPEDRLAELSKDRQISGGSEVDTTADAYKARRDAAIAAKRDAEQYITAAGYYNFVDSRHALPDGMLDLLVAELKKAKIFGAEQANATSRAQAECDELQAEFERQQYAETERTLIGPQSLESRLGKARKALQQAKSEEQQADAQARKYAADLLGQGCTSAEMLLELVLINKAGQGDAASGTQTGARVASRRRLFRRHPSSRDHAEALVVLSEAKYPFGDTQNQNFPPNRPKPDLLPLLGLSDSYTHNAGESPFGLRQRRPGSDRNVSPPAEDFPARTGSAATTTGQLQPDPKFEVEQLVDIQFNSSFPAAVSDSGTSLTDKIPLEFSKQAVSEQQRCIHMLKVLAQMIDDEYSEGGRAHWGSEDRRTKMWFINLSRPLMVRIMVVIFGQFLAATGAGIIKWLYTADDYRE